MGQRGVTLVELMVAMLLLTVALVVLAVSFPYAMYGVVSGGYQTTATLLAQQVIEQAKNTDYANLSSVATAGGAFVGPVVAGPTGSQTTYDGFSKQVTVAAGSPTAATTTVTVTIRYQNVGGTGYPIYDTTMTSIFSE